MKGENDKSPLLVLEDEKAALEESGSVGIQRLRSVRDSEWRICGRDFWYWLQFIRTVDEDSGAIREFPIGYDSLRALDEEISSHTRVVLLKARRGMISWMGMLKRLWRAMFAGTGIPGTFSAYRSGVMSIGEREAEYLMERVSRVYQSLPDWMKDRNILSVDNQLMKRFDKGGVIQAFPLKRFGPQTFGFTDVFFDEMSLQDAARTTWKGMIPTLGAKGEVLAVSTPNGRFNLFYDIWSNKHRQYDDIKRIKLHWWGDWEVINETGKTIKYYKAEHPVHDEVWFEQVTRGLTTAEQEQMFFHSFSVYTADAVWPEFERTVHCVEETSIIDGRPMLLGWDLGYHHPACYAHDTQALTDNGWIDIKDIKVGDIILTLNPVSKKIEYQAVQATVAYPYSGKMYRWINKKNHGVDIEVTANHLMVQEHRGNIQFVPAATVAATRSQGRKFVPHGEWHGKDEHIVLPPHIDSLGRTYDRVDFSARSFAEFMGIYLSEGSTQTKGNHYNINLWQKNQNPAIERILQGTPLKWRWYTRLNRGGFWSTASVQLYHYLKQFGKAREKFVPDEIKEMSVSNISAFLNAYGLGDGHTKKYKIRVIYTASKKMADDLQELFLKVGVFAAVASEPKNCWSVRPRTFYRVPLNRLKIETRLADNEMVYCVTVPNHIIAVRRNGKPLWCGNCVFFQYNNRDQFIGHLEHQGYDIDFRVFCEEVKERLNTIYDRKRLPEIHFLPRDAVTSYGIVTKDGAGNALEVIKSVFGRNIQFRFGATDVGTRDREGTRLAVVRPLWRLRADGRPGIVLNASRMPLFIEGCAGAYCYPETRRLLGGELQSEQPVKNEASHLQDAFQMIVTGRAAMMMSHKPQQKGKKNQTRLGYRSGM